MANQPKPPRLPTLALALLLPHASAGAQIHAHPSAPGAHQPTVLLAPGGVPLVNITTPSAAGVSRNIYRQFDVGTPGAILNNSRSGATTRLGGRVAGNPWLASGPARVILNEVRSTHPSHLNGWIEVAGQRAEVIVANPAGIRVNGGGFINAGRVTLSAGLPVMHAGALEGYRVKGGQVGGYGGGQVHIEGLGLDLRQTDHAAVLARAIEVNAGLWARDLSLVTGANEVSADASEVRPQAPDPTTTDPLSASPTPRFALDVAAIGGMYAGHIHLIGTEAGLGVNQAGTIDASGTLTLDVNGWLSTHSGARTIAQTVDIRAEGLRNQGGAVIAARQHLAVSAQQIHNTEGALLLGLGDMALAASERLENRSATIDALGDLAIATPVLLNANDAFETELVAQPGERYLRLRHRGVDYARAQIGANFSRLDAYQDQPHWFVVLPSATYPFDRFPALASDWDLPAGIQGGGVQLPLTRVQPWLCDGCGNEPAIEPYGPTHPVWQRFGLPSPGPRALWVGLMRFMGT